jgi:hypothetical protein
MKILKGLILYSSLLAIQACNNAIDINAPWKETAVVNGFLDIGTSDQFIRITKTFQNASNLTPAQAAQISDSLYFDTLIVNLYDLTTGTDTFRFIRKDTIAKDAGYFANDKNYLYYCRMQPASGHTYKLEIINPKSGNAYYGQASVIDRANIMNGSTFSSYTVDINYSQYNFVLFEWDIVPNAAVYNSIIRYYYDEYPKGQPQNTVTRYVDESVSVNDITPNASSYFLYRLRATDMNQFLVNTFGGIPALSGDTSAFVRTIKPYLVYIVQVGSSDLKTAIDLSKPNTSLLQVKPNYSNVQNGLGLFTCRSTGTKNIPFSSSADQKNMTKGISGFVQ